MTEWRVRRLGDGPIVHPGLCPTVGSNVNGPSLVRTPDWVPSPLGRYSLYFAHHEGDRLRLAFADELEGPWRTYAPGVLPLERSGFPAREPLPGSVPRAGREGVSRFWPFHVASPDVHVDRARRRVRLYFHGMQADGTQVTKLATSCDGLDFEVRPEVLGPAYFRVFEHQGWWYALSMPGGLLRSRDGLSGFEPGPTLFVPEMRHAAVRVRGNALDVFWTRVGDAPERILHSSVGLRGDWRSWRETPPHDVLAPEAPWEGADLPLAPSVRGACYERRRELRDPAVFEEEGRLYLVYGVAGEQGLAIARLEES